uniref:ARAD1D07040p n=1 Tax=Blastobotrys adeninivorans TaxID=409370 RepID=A0A060TEF8_BLAAD
MSLKLPNNPNAGLFKQGYQTQSAEDGAVSRNITAVNEISNMVRTSIGPCGRNKIVVNHLSKVFLTSDAATILKELEIVHPAAKLVVMASEQQESEMGDATNLVLVLAGELLSKAEDLMRLGLNTTEIAQGYDLAKKFAVKELEELVIDNGDSDEEVSKTVERALKAVVAAKQYGSEDVLSELIGQAVAHVLPKKNKSLAHFNVDSIRVVKIMGSSLEASQVYRGMVFGREPEGSIKKAQKAKVGVFTTPIDISNTETKGTVLLHNAQEMLDFSKGEEAQLDEIAKSLADSGMRVAVAGAGVGELALHYLNKHGILVFRVGSKFDLRRLCRVTGATPLPRLGAPMPEEMGSIDVVETVEIGGDRVTVFRQEDDKSTTRTSTIVLRGATQSALDDLERAIDDGVAVVKALAKDQRLVAGAGAAETELATRVVRHGEQTPGLLQHAIKKFGEALEVIPRTLAENAGLDATETLSTLYAAHARGSISEGVDVDDEHDGGCVDAKAKGVLDLFSAKKYAIELATDAASTVLSVDQIIMAKRAGGPQIPKQGQRGNWDDDD